MSCKMRFKKAVKYNGIKYLPHTIIEVEDEDVNDLKLVGGEVKEKVAPAEEAVQADTKVEAPAEKTEIEQLREKATAQGIEFKKNWGVKKLKEVLGI